MNSTCKNRTKFCFVCSKITFNGIPPSESVKRAYKETFDRTFIVRNYTPSVVCAMCVKTLRQIKNPEKKAGFNFKIPAQWKHVDCHEMNCFLCNAKTAGYTAKSKDSFKPESYISLLPPCNDPSSVDQNSGDEDSMEVDEETNEVMPADVDSNAENEVFFCKNRHKICYVCCKLSFNGINPSDTVKEAYQNYFKIELKIEPFTPSIVCQICAKVLRSWNRGIETGFNFSAPTIWRQPEDHENCFLCMIDTIGYTKKSKKNFEYPLTESVTFPIELGDNEVCPAPPNAWLEDVYDEFMDFDSDTDEDYDMDDEPDYVPSAADSDFKSPSLLSQAEFNDLTRDLKHSKQQALFHASELKRRNLVTPEFRVNAARAPEEYLYEYFSLEDHIAYCNNVNGLMHAMGLINNENEPEDESWRFFLDGNVTSLKACIIHKGNILPSIPLAYCQGAKETYEEISKYLKLIKYSEHKWDICVDLKVVMIILGLMSGYTKYGCPWCLWDTRAHHLHYQQKTWPERSWIIGEENVIAEALVPLTAVKVPPLHIKLGLFRQFVCALPKNGDALEEIGRILPYLSSAKIEGGIFTGPEIRKILEDNNFETKLNLRQKRAFRAYR